MPIQNQGYRSDLNFLEHLNDSLALSNLGGVGIANDLRIINNNLRNTSRLPFNSVDLTTDFFNFITDKVVGVTQVELAPDTDVTNATRITVTLSTPYHTYAGGLVTLAGVTGAVGSQCNGAYPSLLIGTNGNTVAFRKLNTNASGVVSGSDVAGATVTFTSRTTSVYTNDDRVTVSEDVNVGSTTLLAGTDYFICKSDATTQFKLSTTPSTSLLNIIDITAQPNQFNFIRKEPVKKPNLELFIKPEIQDEEEFGGYLRSSINSVLGDVQTRIETANYFITKKFKGTEDTNVDTDILFEGTVNIFDPDGFNNSPANVFSTTLTSPGIFIGGTRAFSADNNPWAPDLSDASNPALATNSEEVSIGELLFGDTLVINGVDVNTDTTVAATSFSHKIPVVVGGETFYLLMNP